MSLGVVRYCTPEGGSGFIANPSLPWLSSYNVQHDVPVYDQYPGWLRNTRPGSFTNYSRFGPPYSVDGGTQPPYYLMADGTPVSGQPVPVSTGCGMGAVDPGQFEARYGRREPDATTCQKIQCGAIPQEQAGMQLIVDCANAGYSLVRSPCVDPTCAPWLNQIPACRPQGGPQVLLRADVVAPMPSITTAARRGCSALPNPCPSDLATWCASNPWLVVALAAFAGAVLFGGQQK